jgi:hypothetical protein
VINQCEFQPDDHTFYFEKIMIEQNLITDTRCLPKLKIAKGKMSRQTEKLKKVFEENLLRD